MVKNVPIGKVKPNKDNPRFIRDEKFTKLCNSLREFPDMAKLRPIIVNAEMVVLGGNMRLRAMQELKWETVPVIVAENLTHEQQAEFVIKDNVGFGEWNWEMLANQWDAELLTDWGLDIPHFEPEPELDDLIGEEKNKPPTLKITFENSEQLQKAEIDIQELLDRKYPKAYFSVSAGEL